MLSQTYRLAVDYARLIPNPRDESSGALMGSLKDALVLLAEHERKIFRKHYPTHVHTAVALTCWDAIRQAAYPVKHFCLSNDFTRVGGTPIKTWWPSRDENKVTVSNKLTMVLQLVSSRNLVLILRDKRLCVHSRLQAKRLKYMCSVSVAPSSLQPP
jgi:hypothetical protein